MGRPLKIAKAQAVVSITGVNGTTEIVTTNANFTNLGIIKGMPFIVGTTTGGMTAGVTYWILEVVNSGNNSTFKVSQTELSANPNYTPMNLTTAAATVSMSVGVVDAYFNNPNGGAGYPATNANTYSVVGGNTAIYGKQVLCRVAIAQNGTGTITVANDSPNINGVGTDFANTLADGMSVATTDGVFLGIVDDIANANATFATFAANAAANVTDVAFEFATNEAGFIVRQKGKQKYLVQGTTSGLVGPCYTANLANAALYPGTMNIVGTYANAATVNVQSLSDHTAELFTANSGVTADPNNTANINNSSPAFGTFNSAYAANTYGGQPYPIVTISNA